MQVWNVLHAARWKYRTQKVAKTSPSAHRRKLCRALYSQLRHVSTIGKSKFQRLSPLGRVTARHSSSGRQPNFAALNRGRHLYSARRPSRWALAHILVCDRFFALCCCYTFLVIGADANVLGLVFSHQAKRLAWASWVTSLKWPILCRSSHKTTTQPINQPSLFLHLFQGRIHIKAL